VSGKNSVILDAEKGKAMARFGEDQRRIVLMTSEAFVKMMATLLHVFGSAAFSILYVMGEEKGRYDVLKVIEALRRQKISFVKRQILENIVREVKVTGWGAPEIQKYDEKRGTLTIQFENNPLIVVLGTDKPDRPVCHFFRGYWVGVVSEVWETNVNCAETKCISTGDAYCEFNITLVGK